MKITLFSKEICLAISRVVNPDQTSEADLLFFLPDSVFDKTFQVTMCEDAFTTAWSTSNPDWRIPTYFVKSVHDS